MLDLSDPSIACLLVRDNIKRRIRTLRQKNQLVKEPNDPKFVSVPMALIKTVRGCQFLRCDIGPDRLFDMTNDIVLLIHIHFANLGDDRILIFSSDEQLNILQNTEDFLVDGTFKVVPAIFYQLYIIHGVHRDHVVPVIYALLRRKNADTYHRLISKILKFAPRWSPRSIMLDFEQTCIGV